jgi:hypothetical protein
MQRMEIRTLKFHSWGAAVDDDTLLPAEFRTNFNQKARTPKRNSPPLLPSTAAVVWIRVTVSTLCLSSLLFEGPTPPIRRRHYRGQQQLYHQMARRTESSEEEFFCLTPEDPIKARSRNASSSSTQQKFQPMLTAPHAASQQAAATVPVSMPDTKIFSVAVEEGSKCRAGEMQAKMDNMKICDLDTGFSGKFAVVAPLDKVRPPAAKMETATSTPKAEEVMLSAVPSSDANGNSKSSKKIKKKKSKNGKKEEPAELKTARTRDVDSPPKEVLVDLDSGSPSSASATLTTVFSDVLPAEKVKSSEVKVGRDEDEDDETFFIKEDVEDDDQEQSRKQGNFCNFDPDSSARPRLPSWANDLIKRDDSIIAGIESAGKKYDGSPSKAAMSESTGFNVECLKPQMPAAEVKTKDEEEIFNFRPSYSRKVKKGKISVSSDDDFPPLVPGPGSSSESSSLMEEAMMEEVRPLPPTAQTQEYEQKEDEDKGIAQKEIDGWSFEADDLDVNKLIEEVVGPRGQVECAGSMLASKICIFVLGEMGLN